MDRDIDDTGGKIGDRVVGGKRSWHPGAVLRIRHSDQAGQHRRFPRPRTAGDHPQVLCWARCSGQPGHQLRQRLAAPGEEPAGPGRLFHPAAAGIPVLFQRPPTAHPGPSLCGRRQRRPDRQCIWVTYAQLMPPLGRRRQRVDGSDRHEGQRRLTLGGVMHDDDPYGLLTIVRVSGEHEGARHALPLRSGQHRRQRPRGAGHLEGKQPIPLLRTRQDVAADLPGVLATALRQDGTGFAEPGETDRPAARNRRRTAPVNPRETNRRHLFIEPRVGDLQQRQILLGQLIADQHHPGGELTSRNGAYQQLSIIAWILPVIDVVRGSQHQPATDQIARPAGPPSVTRGG